MEELCHHHHHLSLRDIYFLQDSGKRNKKTTRRQKRDQKVKLVETQGKASHRENKLVINVQLGETMI